MKGRVEIEKTLLAQRALLAESLLNSLPPLPDDWSEAKEMEEVKRPEREIETSKVHPVSEEELWCHVEVRRRNSA